MNQDLGEVLRSILYTFSKNKILTGVVKGDKNVFSEVQFRMKNNCQAVEYVIPVAFYL